jgi:ribosome-binding factor A
MSNPKTIARVAARIHERAAQVVAHQLSDPRAGFVTVTRVEVSPDLGHAKIYYSVLGTPGERSQVEHMLRRASGYVQREVARSLELRRAPQLAWHYDDSIETAAHVQDAIREAIERDRRIHPGAHPDVAPDGDPARDELVVESEYNGFLEQQEGDGDRPSGKRPRGSP